MTRPRVLAGTALVLLAVALVAPPIGAAHIVPRPAFIAQGTPTSIAFDVPNERPPHATVGVTLTAPRGFSVVSADSTPGWQATIDHREVTWAGGRLEGAATATFTVRLLTDVEPGPVTLEAVQRYDDGQSVTWKIPFSVVPGAEPRASSASDSGRLVIGAVVGVLVVGGTLAVLLVFRWRSGTR